MTVRPRSEIFFVLKILIPLNCAYIVDHVKQLKYNIYVESRSEVPLQKKKKTTDFNCFVNIYFLKDNFS